MPHAHAAGGGDPLAQLAGPAQRATTNFVHLVPQPLKLGLVVVHKDIDARVRDQAVHVRDGLEVQALHRLPQFLLPPVAGLPRAGQLVQLPVVPLDQFGGVNECLATVAFTQKSPHERLRDRGSRRVGSGRTGCSALVVDGLEHVYPSAAGTPAMTVAPPCRLGDRLQRRHRPVHHGEVHVHTRLDALRTDQPNGPPRIESLPDVGQHPLTMHGTHGRGQMHQPLGSSTPQEPEQFLGVSLDIHDAHPLLGLLPRKPIGQGVQREWRILLPADLRSPAGGCEQLGLCLSWHDGARLPSALGDLLDRAIEVVKRRLGGRGKHHRRAEPLAQAGDRTQRADRQFLRNRLNLVEQQYALGQAMQLPTVRRSVRQERFETAHRRGQHDGGIPVLRQQASGLVLVPSPVVLRVAAGETVIFQDVVVRETGLGVEQVAVQSDRLIDDVEIGHDQHDSPKSVD